MQIKRKYARLEVKSEVEPIFYGKIKHRRMLCICDCGKEKIVNLNDLNQKKTTSCGCYRKEFTSLKSKKLNTKHGLSSSKTYNSWLAMRRRCLDKNSKGFKNYGGRGIKICEEWLNSFESFLKDVGFRPEGMTLDRIDNNGHYELNNVKWSSAKDQANNRRKKQSYA